MKIPFAMWQLDERLRQLGIEQAAKHFNESPNAFYKFFGKPKHKEENMETMRGRLFEYAVIYHPKAEKDKPAKKSVLLGEVQRVLANNESEVSILAARSIPDEHLAHLEDIEIGVRPF